MDIYWNGLRIFFSEIHIRAQWKRKPAIIWKIRSSVLYTFHIFPETVWETTFLLWIVSDFPLGLQLGKPSLNLLSILTDIYQKIMLTDFWKRLKKFCKNKVQISHNFFHNNSSKKFFRHSANPSRSLKFYHPMVFSNIFTDIPAIDYIFQCTDESVRLRITKIDNSHSCEKFY